MYDLQPSVFQDDTLPTELGLGEDRLMGGGKREKKEKMRKKRGEGGERKKKGRKKGGKREKGKEKRPKVIYHSQVILPGIEPSH